MQGMSVRYQIQEHQMEELCRQNRREKLKLVLGSPWIWLPPVPDVAGRVEI